MAERGSIQCGDEVSDSITGFSGIVVAVTAWLNGCVRVTIQPRLLHEGKPIEGQTFDIEQLILVKSAAVPSTKPTGGPHSEPSRPAAPKR